MKYLLLLLISVNVAAHEGHSWLDDSKAYKSVKKISFLKKAILKKFTKPKIETDFLITKLKELSGAKSVLIGNEQITIKERKSAQNRIHARNFLAQEYKKLGYDVRILAYGNKNTKGVKWGGADAKQLVTKKANFVAEKLGRDPNKVLILSSHLDSVGNAGANDDGSGTIAALAIAKAIKDTDFEYSIRFIAFDQEEIGLKGSAAYARAIPMEERNNIIGLINMEMMATNSRNDGAFHVIDCDRSESQFLRQKIVNAIQTYNIDLTPSSACTNRSDHASFWKRNIPAVVLSENFFGGDNDPCYHRTCDIVDERIDFDYMRKIAEAVTIASMEILVPLN